MRTMSLYVDGKLWWSRQVAVSPAWSDYRAVEFYARRLKHTFVAGVTWRLCVNTAHVKEIA